MFSRCRQNLTITSCFIRFVQNWTSNEIIFSCLGVMCCVSKWASILSRASLNGLWVSNKVSNIWPPLYTLRMLLYTSTELFSWANRSRFCSICTCLRRHLLDFYRLPYSSWHASWELHFILNLLKYFWCQASRSSCDHFYLFSSF